MVIENVKVPWALIIVLFMITSCAPGSFYLPTVTSESSYPVTGSQPSEPGIEAGIIDGLVNSLIGFMLASEMDEYDRQQLNHVLERGVPGKALSWDNPVTGNGYIVTPTANMIDAIEPCRQASVVAEIDNNIEVLQIEACREASGQWVVQ